MTTNGHSAKRASRFIAAATVIGGALYRLACVSGWAADDAAPSDASAHADSAPPRGPSPRPDAGNATADSVCVDDESPPIAMPGDQPAVAATDAGLRLWYTGWSANSGVVFTSSSTDGRSWLFDDECTFGGRRIADMLTPDVTATSTGYLMYSLHRFLADDHDGGSAYHLALARATSANGIAWSAPVDVLPELTSGWDRIPGEPSIVTLPNGSQRLYYAAREEQRGVSAIGFASSEDGVTWTRHGEPVLVHGAAREFDELAVSGPSVVHDGKRFVMFYRGERAAPADSGGRTVTLTFGVAVSDDGVAWTRVPSSSLAVAEGSWTGAPVARRAGGRFSVWYMSLADRRGAHADEPPSIRRAFCTVP